MFLGGNKPSRVGNIRGDIGINFSCDPDISSTLVSFPILYLLFQLCLVIPYVTLFFLEKVDLALDEILRLQEDGPSDEDVSTVLEIEQRAHENGLQVMFTTSYL